MTTCVYCEKARGKRECPALGGRICPPCCGEHRLKRISCPASCKYLKRGERYQQERVAEDFHARWVQAVTPLYQRRDRAALDYLIALEAAIYRHVRANPATDDQALNDALDTLKRQLSPIHVVESYNTGLGKKLVTFTERYQKEHPSFDPEGGQAVADLLLGLIPSELGSREAVSGLMGHLDAYFDPPESSPNDEGDAVTVPRIITPD